MTQLARPLFIVILVVGAIMISATTDHLPAQIASHFGAGGVPNGWMSRSFYLLFMLAFAVILPLVIVLSMGVLPRYRANAINIPNRVYWLDPVRRQATLDYLAAHACWLGSLMVVFITAIHFLLIEANATQPPRLPFQPFIAVLVIFVVAMGLWLAALVLRFRNRN
jgi:uncharacterized membrane protein